jgi:cell division septation protein DedD
MVKLTALLFNSIALFFYQLLFTDNISVTPKFPQQVKAGDEFVVEVTINKGGYTGFAKIQQELPEGFTAIEEDSHGGSFTFINQTVRIIWMSLPNEASYKISYKVKVATEVSGTKTVNGTFSFVTDNVKQNISIPETSIKVTSENEVASSNQIITTKTTQSEEEKSSLICTRKLPSTILASNEFFVEININKGNIGGFAKLTETLPEGFSAIAVESKGAAFSFDDKKVTFIWGVLPPTSEFKVSYKVRMEGNVSGEKLIEGVFSFIENDQTMKYVLSPGFIKVIGSNDALTIIEKPKEQIQSTVNNTNAVVTQKEKTPPAKTETKKQETPPPSLSASSIPSTQSKAGINYKVQILALRKAKDIQVVLTFFGLSETVSLESADGYTKYTVGFHDNYSSAREARNIIRGKNPVLANSFVTAYNKGRRITVQEALMISNQKWDN